MDNVNNLQTWQAMADKKLEYVDPRFEQDQVKLTMILAEHFRTAVANVVLGNYRDAKQQLSRVRLALKSKIHNEYFADYSDQVFWLLWSWISEDDVDRPRIDNVLAAKHRQILSEMEINGNMEIAEWYREIVEMLDLPKSMKISLPMFQKEPEKAYVGFAYRTLDLARLWTWKEDLEDFDKINRLVEVAFLSMGKGNELKVKRLGINRQDAAYSRLGDLNLLKKAHPDKFQVFKEFKEWEQGRLHFFYAQCRALSAIASFVKDPSRENFNEADEAVREMFEEARKPSKMDFADFNLLEQIQWARIGAAYALKEHSKKPLNVIRRYLGGVETAGVEKKKKTGL